MHNIGMSNITFKIVLLHMVYMSFNNLLFRRLRGLFFNGPLQTKKILGVYCRADSANLVQCFITLCRLYFIKIVFRIFCGGYYVVVKFIILMEGVTQCIYNVICIKILWI